MIPQKTPEETATNRVMMITPLLEPELDPQRIIQIKKELCEKHDVSYRTIDRYYQAYKQEGFEGLKPKTSYQREKTTLPDNYPNIVEQAVILRRECPSRSVQDIIKILELEGVVPVRALSRSWYYVKKKYKLNRENFIPFQHALLYNFTSLISNFSSYIWR